MSAPVWGGTPVAKLTRAIAFGFHSVKITVSIACVSVCAVTVCGVFFRNAFPTAQCSTQCTDEVMDFAYDVSPQAGAVSLKSSVIYLQIIYNLYTRN